MVLSMIQKLKSLNNNSNNLINPTGTRAISIPKSTLARVGQWPAGYLSR